MTVDRATGAILQAGVAFGPDGQPFHAYAGASAFPQRNFYLNLKDLPREISAGHAGCSAMARATWHEVGGWSPNLAMPMALYDLCLRAMAAGYDNLYLPLARFTTGRPLAVIPPVAGSEWAWREFQDPFWNANLSPGTPDGLPFRWTPAREPDMRPGGTGRWNLRGAG
jgi:hypothetical protein